MSAKVTQRTELGPVRAFPTARYARVERGNGLSLRGTRSWAWIAVAEAHHAALPFCHGASPRFFFGERDSRSAFRTQKLGTR